MLLLDMPAQPSWHLRVPDILAALRGPAAPPFLDRSAIETLFHLRRRQAIRMMHFCGGYQVGKTFLVDREGLIDLVERVDHTGGVELARQRKQRISAALNEVANHAVARSTQIRTDPALLSRRPADLPAASERVAPGKIQISYHGATDLLAAATHDFPRFRKIFEGSAP